MRLWVTGAAGALGSEVVEAGRRAGHEVVATTHGECPIEDAGAVLAVVKAVEPEVIINCAGQTPGAESIPMILTNAVGPHVLAAMGLRVVHMSTDCVFGGRAASTLQPRDPPSPVDLYGRSKLAGEVSGDRVLNVRGSFLTPKGGFLKWLLQAEGQVDAWEKAYWNGTSVMAMAETLVGLANDPDVGVVHAASQDFVTKGQLVEFFRKRLDLPITVRHVDEPMIWRVLAPEVTLPPLYDCLDELVEEVRACPTPALP